MKNASIRDIAKNLNLSATTISKVINGTGNIGEETRRRVLDEAHRLKYLPNRMARKLKEGNKLIGIFAEMTHSDEFVAKKLKGVCGKAGESGYDIMLFFIDFDDDRHDSKIWEIIREYSLSGVISLLPIRPSIQKKIHEYNIPHVAINWIANLTNETPLIATDIGKVLECAADHFYERGKRNMVYVHWYGDRLDVNRCDKTELSGNIIGKALERLHQKYEDMKIDLVAAYKNFTIEEMTDIFSHGEYDAFLFLYYKHGFMYMDYARENNIRIPEETALIIYDHQEYWDFFTPKYTGIRQPIYELGELGCERLIAKIEGKEATVANTFLDPMLIKGETT